MANNLTPKQEKFVQGLFVGLSQREAYKQAYPDQKMSDKTIDEKACLLSRNDKVVARLTELQGELKDRNMVTVERILAEYAKIGFADIKDFVEFKTAKTVVEYAEDGTPIIDYKTIVDAKDSSEVDGTLINEVSIGKDGTFKFKLHDKMNALEKMGKTLGMFKDKTEIDLGNKDDKAFKTESKTDLSKLSVEELKNLAGIIRKASDSGRD